MTLTTHLTTSAAPVITSLMPLIKPYTVGNVSASWHTTLPAELDQEISVTHLMHTPAWAAAWSTVTTEWVLDSRFLHLRQDGVDRLAAFHLIGASRFWDWLESAAGHTSAYPLLFLGSAYATYGGAGLATPDMIATAVDSGLEAARHWGAGGLVVPNLTPELLTAWKQIRPGARRVASSITYTGAMPTGHLAEALPRRRQRQAIARQARRAADAGVSMLHLHGADMLPSLGRFAQLATKTSLRHGTDIWGPDIFTAAAGVPGAVLIAAGRNGSLVGGFFCFRYAERLYAWVAGLDYAHLHELGLYGALVHESARYAVATGARVLDMGRANHVYKVSLGLLATPLTSLVYPMPPALPRQAGCGI
ncbi:GNAT family N-acetyltransferase [Streptosporangium canum]|uniref:GNAT family N-acetyltransferase n=1 Tax=Streptosporangium canum TaxID=324952 RepID=UPI0036997525